MFATISGMIEEVRPSRVDIRHPLIRKITVFTVMGVAAASSIVACSSGPDQPRSVAEQFASALTDDDVTAAANLTTDPAAASTAISAMIDGLGKDEERSRFRKLSNPETTPAPSLLMQPGTSGKAKTGRTPPTGMHRPAAING